MCKTKQTFTKEVAIKPDHIYVDDGGCYKEFAVEDNEDEDNEDEDNGMFIRVCSWDDFKEHKDFNRFINRKLKITIETIDD